MSQLETNTTSLQTLLDKVNALPEAGGASVETCTVRLYSTDGAVCLTGYAYTSIDDNGVMQQNVVYVTYDDTYATFDITIPNVVCGSMLVVVEVAQMDGSATFVTDNAEYMNGLYWNFSGTCTDIVRISAPAGGTATLKLYDDD